MQGQAVCVKGKHRRLYTGLAQSNDSGEGTVCFQERG